MRSIHLLCLTMALLAAAALPGTAAPLINFTGNVDTDFVGSGVQSFPDTLPAQLPGSFAAGDAPLGPASYVQAVTQPYGNSGFNVERVVVAYRDTADDPDALYVGLDISDLPSPILDNIPVPPVPWDADGNGNRSVVTTVRIPNVRTLIPELQDNGPEDYNILIDLNKDGTFDLTIRVSSFGNEEPTVSVIGCAGLDITGVWWDSHVPVANFRDIELRISGLKGCAQALGLQSLCGGFDLQTISGATLDAVDEDRTLANVSVPCLSITKQVACAPTGPFTEKVTVVRGTDVYFRITVTNDGSEALNDVVITDILSNLGGALLACSECNETSPQSPGAVACFIPGVLPLPDRVGLPDLQVGETRTFVCRVPTNPAYATQAVDPDAVNSSTATGTGASSGLPATAGPDTAEVNVLVPCLTCKKEVKSLEGGDYREAPQGNPLDLTGDGVMSNELVKYRYTLTNCGEVDINFTQGVCPDGGFIDSLLEHATNGITPTPIDLDALFLAQLANGVLPAGATVTAETPDLTFNEELLCPQNSIWQNDFSACGLAVMNGVCGSEPMTTGPCSAYVRIFCHPEWTIEKKVACEPDAAEEDWLDSATALRGATVYFRIRVTNTGPFALDDMVLTDTVTDEIDNALLACVACNETSPQSPGAVPCFIPGQLALPDRPGNVPDLQVGETRTFICQVPTNPAFATKGTAIDARNTVTGVAKAPAFTDPNLDILPDPLNDSVTVNLLVPDLDCDKLVWSNALPDQKVKLLDFNVAPWNDGVTDNESITYRLSLTNSGEVDIDFDLGNCPNGHFIDSLLEVNTPGIVVTPQNVDALFLAQLPNGVLPAGQTVFVDIPITLQEAVLCANARTSLVNDFSACGLATEEGICLPPGGGETVTTGPCSAEVRTLCVPDMTIVKRVACSATAAEADWKDSATALRGATVFFRIQVTNTGNQPIRDVTITDTVTDEIGDALLPCVVCNETSPQSPGPVPCFIPGQLALPDRPGNVPDLQIGETRTFICEVPTNPAFATKATAIDARNNASASGTSTYTNTLLNRGPSSVTVNLLVPDLDCDKLVWSNALPDQKVKLLDFTTAPWFDGVMDNEAITYRLTLTNSGEVDIDFDLGNCPNGHFIDSLLETAVPGLVVTPQNIDALFLAQLPNGVLLKGQTVTVDIPLTMQEPVLCNAGISVLENAFSACGLATEAGICLPPGGGETVTTGPCEAEVRPFCECSITASKRVACDPAGPWLPAVSAIAGSKVYFRVQVTNTGVFPLDNVSITDVLTDPDAAKKACICWEVTGGGNVAVPCFIPGVLTPARPGADLNPGETRTFICEVQTDPNFSHKGTAVDMINVVEAEGTCPGGTIVNTDNVPEPDRTAQVNLLVASLSCVKEAQSDEKPGVWVPHLNVQDGTMDAEAVTYRVTLTNDGEVPIDFCKGSCADHFSDSLLEQATPGIDGAPIDLDSIIKPLLQNNCILPPGASIQWEMPVTFQEEMLCPRTVWENVFRACGLAEVPQVPGVPPVCGSVDVSTSCEASVLTFCPPDQFQVYPARSLPYDPEHFNGHQGGELGQFGDTVTAISGVLKIVPGDNWANFIQAAQQGVPYTIKNVVLRKQTPPIIQCADVFPVKTISQQGTANIRLWWPLMYEVPGTSWTLTIVYGTNTPWDDDGPGPHAPAYVHTETWNWSVGANLRTMELLLQLFHEVPFGLDEVPLISDEVLYPVLLQKLADIRALVASGNLTDAGLLLGDFEMEVMDACLAVSPPLPDPTGSGTGIANTLENPACCKILADAEYVGFALGILTQRK